MLYNVLKLAHLLSVIVWIGGMVFAHFFLRPAAQELEPPQRVRLMYGVLRRFFMAIAVAVAVVLSTGMGMIGTLSVQSAGAFSMPRDWSIMATLGLVMTGIFAYVYFAPFTRLQLAVEASDWPQGAQALARIRGCVGVNLVLGTVIVAVTILM